MNNDWPDDEVRELMHKKHEEIEEIEEIRKALVEAPTKERARLVEHFRKLGDRAYAESDLRLQYEPDRHNCVERARMYHNIADHIANAGNEDG